MEALRDLTWVRQLLLPSVERLELRGFHLAIVSVPATAVRHGDRFRYRLLAIDPSLGRPVLSVDLESDILGDYCLSVQLASEHQVLARYDRLPGIEEFRQQALAEAERRLPALAGAGTPAIRPGKASSGSSKSRRGGHGARPR